MDDKHILQFISRRHNEDNINRRERYGHRQYNGCDNGLKHSIGKSMGLRQNNIKKMPMDGEIVYPTFGGEERFMDTIRQKYPTPITLKQKKNLLFISRNDEF